MLYHKNFFHNNNRRALGNLGEYSNTWRKKRTWIYANHHDTYILTVNCVLLYHWVCCKGCLGCSGFFCVLTKVGWNTVNQRGWKWALCTIMVFSHQSGSSIACHLWITYTITILFQLNLGLNPISLQFHTCYGQGWMSCSTGGTTCS